MKKILLMAVAVVIGGQFLAAQDTKSGILSNVTQLTNDDVKYENPRWSPDGEKKTCVLFFNRLNELL